ncbi:hypothetical protein [Cupriavidus laharis]|uniref:hypothetical protein n=1 Tax=Cupriavidus laharis TaxID=151654 RepID=UPI001CC4D95D|nr:hypothetical protein [Cupriavidus laharis]
MVFAAEIIKQWILSVKKNNRGMWKTKINHNIIGGVFDLNNSLFVIYGLPDAVDLANPQAMRLSIYALNRSPRKIMSRTYGGGVFEVSISQNHDFVLVNGRFDLDLINNKTKMVKSFNLLSEPDFEKQECVRK